MDIINDIQLNENNEVNNNSYYDFGSLSMILIVSGFLMLFTFILFYIGAFMSTMEGTWEGSFAGNVNAIICALPLGIVLLIAGIVMFIFHRLFSDLGDFAEEVESGEFEEKIISELELEE
jgi:hypothetical protein